jgi:HSP20 family protein
MSALLRRDPRAMFPDLMDWFESPFVTLRPYLAQAIRIEEYAEGDHYVVRAELAGLDPAKDVEITVADGYLTIRAERTEKTEGKHRSEFRYGSFSRTVSLPPAADEDNVTADYQDGILTVTVGMKQEKKVAAKKIEVTTGK